MKNKLKKLGWMGAIAVAALYGCKKDNKLEAGKGCTQVKHETAYVAKINNLYYEPTTQQVKASDDSCGVTKINIKINGDTIKTDAQARTIGEAFSGIDELSEKVKFYGNVVVRNDLEFPNINGVTVTRWTPAVPADTIPTIDPNLPSESTDTVPSTPADSVPSTPVDSVPSTNPNAPNADSIAAAAACGAKNHADTTYTWDAANKKCVATYNKPVWYRDSLDCVNEAAPFGYEKNWNASSHACVTTEEQPDTLDLTLSSITSGAQLGDPGFSGQKWVDVRAQIDGLKNRTGKTPNVIFVNSSMTDNNTYVITANGLNRTVWAADPTQTGDIKVQNKNGTAGNMEIGCVTDLSTVNINIAKKFTAAAIKVNKPNNFSVAVVPSVSGISYDIKPAGIDNKVNISNRDRYLMKFAAFGSTENGFPVMFKPGLDAPYGLSMDGEFIKAKLPSNAFVVLDNSSTVSNNTQMDEELKRYTSIEGAEVLGAQTGSAPVFWRTVNDLTNLMYQMGIDSYTVLGQ